MRCATTAPERSRTVRNRFRISWIAVEGGSNRRRDRVFPIIRRSFRLTFIPGSSLSSFLSITFYSNAIYHFRAYPKRTQHPLLNATLLFDKAWKGPFCFASVCSIVGFHFLSTSFHPLSSSTSESFAIFSAIMFPLAFLQNTLFLFRIKENDRKVALFAMRSINKIVLSSLQNRDSNGAIFFVKLFLFIKTSLNAFRKPILFGSMNVIL